VKWRKGGWEISLGIETLGGTPDKKRLGESLVGGWGIVRERRTCNKEFRKIKEKERQENLLVKKYFFGNTPRA